ncbi:MAG: S8 family serine peptidase [Lachnospiraceae bacterium]
MNRVREALHATEIHRAGITGRGITAAVLDTGISRHPDYSERIVAFRDLSTESRRVMMTPHGTHVAGILGSGKSSGGNIVESHPAAGSFPEKCSIALGQAKWKISPRSNG